jgi:uncharacterized cupredoxin-like copper-binding protein
MNRDVKGLSLFAPILLIVIIAIGFVMWSLNLVAQQRTFAFLLSAELIAFAMLVYLYYVENLKDVSKDWLAIGSASLIVLILLSVAVFPGVMPSAPTPNVNVTLYEGEISLNANSTLYGFGYAANNLTSPGPTLTFNMSSIVNMTVINVGQMSHNWALVSSNQTSAPVLFHAQIQSENNPLLPNQTGSVVFTVSQTGDFYYICQVPGHVSLGMWGKVTVNP